MFWGRLRGMYCKDYVKVIFNDIPVLPAPLSPEIKIHWSRLSSFIERYASSDIA